MQIPSANSAVMPLDVTDSVFGQQFNETLVHQLVVSYMAAGRAGTKAQKTRSEVSGGGAKPWKQKGSGRARAGTTRGPLWRTGGVTFAAKPRSYQQKLNKKMYRSAMRSIFSELLRQGRLQVIESLTPNEPKTKELVNKLKDMGINGGLLITDNLELNLVLAARNIPGFDVCGVMGLNPVRLVHSDTVLITPGAARVLEEGLV
ncbi:MAG: 50S ribosomal protein L4 [Methylococcaceae bacterium]